MRYFLYILLTLNILVPSYSYSHEQPDGDPKVFYHPNGNCYTKDTTLYPHCHLFNSNSVNMHNSKRHDRNVSIMRLYNLGTMIIGQWHLR